MSSLFEDRERSYEAKWAHDEELHFKIMSLRNMLLAHWAADLMALPGNELAEYTKAVTAAGVSDPKSDPVFVKIRSDLAARNIACSDSAIRKKMKDLYAQVEQEVTRR